MSVISTKQNPLDTHLDTTLVINEIFYSIQGETTLSGLPTVFIRLTGCPLRCQYCDTEYAFYEGTKNSFKDILEKASSFNTQYITVTGGEPLAQKNCSLLLTELANRNYSISLETSGAYSIKEIDNRIKIILDVKTPASNEAAKNIPDNFKYLKNNDELKFVICDRGDYEWSKTFIKKHQLLDICNVLFSNDHGSLNPADLADWILKDQLPVRQQIQLHKYLWGDTRGK